MQIFTTNFLHDENLALYRLFDEKLMQKSWLMKYNVFYVLYT